MKRIALAAAALLLAVGPALASEPSERDLNWMVGVWVQEEGDVVTRETWSAPLGGALGGVGMTSKPGKPTSFEFMTITPEAAGATFTAYIRGQEPTPFVLKPGQQGVAVFENLEHDFPQRVIYRKCGDDLCGRIEGMMDGKLKGIDWRYRRER